MKNTILILTIKFKSLFNKLLYGIEVDRENKGMLFLTVILGTLFLLLSFLTSLLITRLILEFTAELFITMSQTEQIQNLSVIIFTLIWFFCFGGFKKIVSFITQSQDYEQLITAPISYKDIILAKILERNLLKAIFFFLLILIPFLINLSSVYNLNLIYSAKMVLVFVIIIIIILSLILRFTLTLLIIDFTISNKFPGLGAILGLSVSVLQLFMIISILHIFLPLLPYSIHRDIIQSVSSFIIDQGGTRLFNLYFLPNSILAHLIVLGELEFNETFYLLLYESIS